MPTENIGKGEEREIERKGKRGPDQTFLPRTGPRRNVIMLIRDWFENVKCTRRNTAGYHEPPSIGFLSLSLILYAALFCLSFSLCLSSPSLRAQIFMESSLSRASYIPHRSLASRLVLSRRGPGDQKRFNLRYHRWRANVSSLDFGGFSQRIRDEVRFTSNRVSAAQVSFPARTKNTTAALSFAERVR